MVTKTSPASAAANWVSVHSGRLSDQTPMRSPRCRPEREQAGGEIARAGSQLLPGPGDAMTRRYQRRPLRPTLGGARQRLPDRRAQQRFRADAADIAECRWSHPSLPLRLGFAAGTLRNSLAHVKRTAAGIPLPVRTGTVAALRERRRNLQISPQLARPHSATDHVFDSVGMEVTLELELADGERADLTP